LDDCDAVVLIDQRRVLSTAHCSAKEEKDATYLLDESLGFVV
jgi:hypothetical protein